MTWTYKNQSWDDTLIDVIQQHNHADLILTDPPFGITGYKWDNAPDLDRFMGLAFECTGGKPVVVFGCQPFTSTVVLAMGKHFRYEWIWEKHKATGHLQAKHRPMRAHENIVVGYTEKVFNPQFTKGDPYKGTPRGTSANDGIYQSYGAHRADNDGKRYPRSVQKWPAKQRQRIHGTQKPVDLLRYIVRTYTNPGDLVCDPFAGSGSTGVAAVLEGRRAALGDTDGEIVERGREWINSIGENNGIT